MNNNQNTYNQPPMGQVPMGAMMPSPEQRLEMPMRQRAAKGLNKIKDVI